MELKTLVALFLLSTVVMVVRGANEDEEFKQGDMICNIIKFGSTIQCKRLGSGDCGNTTEDSGNEKKCCGGQAPVAIRILKLVEVDENGTAVGGDKHSVTLTKNDFKPKAGGPKNGEKLPNSNLKGKKREIDVELEPTPGKKAKLTMTLFLVDEDGNIENGDEVTQVKKGNLKINTRLVDWYWCGSGSGEDNTNCDGKAGAAVMMFFAVENKKANGRKPTPEQKESKKPRKFSMDCGAVTFSNKVLLDNQTWEDMGDEYPTVEDLEDDSPGKGQGSKKPGAKKFGVKIPKFSTSADYDPTLDLEDDSDGSGSASVLPGIGLFATLIFVILSL